MHSLQHGKLAIIKQIDDLPIGRGPVADKPGYELLQLCFTGPHDGRTELAAVVMDLLTAV